MAKGQTRKPYRYQALPQEGSIRLLQLLPGKANQRIQCRLQTVNVQDCPPYEAISYVWGPRKEKTHIFCHGKLVKIPTNLLHCLQRLRHERESRILWADSICINQKNRGERSRQVRIMGSIYERAERVLIWFGRGLDFDTKAAFDLIKCLAPRCRDFSKKHPLSHEEETELQLYAEQLPSTQWEAFGALLKNPWPTRGWVLQEIGLARDGLVICGMHEAPWQNFGRVASHVSLFCAELQIRYGLRVATVVRIATSNFRNSNASRGKLLRRMRYFDTSDPRDRIYALLAHEAFQKSQQHTSNPIPVDYELPVSEVYLQTARFLLKSKDPLFLLALVGHTREIIQGGNRPISWIPQWHVKYSPPILYRSLGYNAAKSTNPQLSQHDTILEARGLCIDCIDWQSDILESARLERAAKKGKGYHPLISILEKLAKLDGDSQAVEERLRHFCLTLNGRSCIRSGGYRPALSAEERFSDFLAFLRRFGVQLESTLTLEKKYGLGHTWRFCETTRPCYGRRFFITKKGYFGIGPKVSLPGDKICVFFGGAVPFVLWPQANNEYRLCGECYVHGLMDGEAIDMWERGEVEDETFTMT